MPRTNGKPIKAWAVLRVYGHDGSFGVFDTCKTRRAARQLRDRAAEELKERRCRWCVARILEQ